jgi:hypothetical protein
MSGGGEEAEAFGKTPVKDEDQKSREQYFKSNEWRSAGSNTAA